MLKNQKGNAIFEILPVMFLFILMVNVMLGFFGAVHSGILNSIAARNYTFETFRNRANLNYFRDVPMAPTDLADGYLTNYQYRFHGIVSEGATPDVWQATKRQIKFSDAIASTLGAGPSNDKIHTTVIPSMAPDGQSISLASKGALSSDNAYQDFTAVWVRTVYGICLTCACGNSDPSCRP